jgi:protocatechuate 3,4-dioxygenase beta subunit
MNITRRRLLGLIPSALGAMLLAACGGDEEDEPQTGQGAATGSTEPTAAPEATAAGSGSTARLAPTPACGDDDEPTLQQTAGPFFTPDSPQRTSLLEDGVTGTTLLLGGSVVNTNCDPIENALVDFWQCDGDGEYDNVGYRLRGHQFTDASGAYRLETIVPGVYPGRTRHIHVKVQAPDQPVLTTQLYFPDEPENASDGIFDASLVMETAEESGAQTGSFRFVLDV